MTTFPYVGAGGTRPVAAAPVTRPAERAHTAGATATRHLRTAATFAAVVLRLVLVVGALAFAVAAAWDVARPLGLLAGCLACLILEATVKGGAHAHDRN